jgi:hypothetical protein
MRIVTRSKKRIAAICHIKRPTGSYPPPGILMLLIGVIALLSYAAGYYSANRDYPQDLLR